MGVISVRGITSSVTDGVTIRAAKYITGNFVPVIGKMFADATDTVISASLLVKNAIGLSGVIIILFLCAFPAIKIPARADLQCGRSSHAAAGRDTDCNLPADDRQKHDLCIRGAGRRITDVLMAVTIMLTAGNVTVMMR